MFDQTITQLSDALDIRVARPSGVCLHNYFILLYFFISLHATCFHASLRPIRGYLIHINTHVTPSD